VIEAILVQQSRKYPEGAAELTSFAWSVLSIGGIIGSVAAAFITEYSIPQYCFGGAAFCVVIQVILSIYLNPEVEHEGEQE